jgi:threonyl-tRNA synthetase
MIHRAPFGSMERFCGVLIEHFAGAFPTWLSPEQVRVLTISEKTDDFARAVFDQLKAAGIRASLDDASEKIGAKIRSAQLEKIPYMLVIGQKEAEANSVSVRHRSRGDIGVQSVEAFLESVTKEVAERAL